MAYLIDFGLASLHNNVSQLLKISLSRSLFLSVYTHTHTHTDTPAKAGDEEDADLIPELERSLGERNGNPLQYFCLGNPMDRRAWQATDHGVTNKSDMTKQLSTRAYVCSIYVYMH